MGLITGYICFAAMLILMLKYPARKFQWRKANQLLMKYHKYAAALLFLAGILHFVLVLPVLKSRMSVILITGILSWVTGFVLTAVCHMMKDRKKEAKLHRLFSLIILFTAVLHLIFYWEGFNNYKSRVSEIFVQEVDISGIPDGVYIGESDVGYIYAKVQLTVKDGTIEKAELLEHRNERGTAAESVLAAVVFEQQLDVDTVSGATNSSKVIKKACENALKEK